MRRRRGIMRGRDTSELEDQPRGYDAPLDEGDGRQLLPDADVDDEAGQVGVWPKERGIELGSNSSGAELVLSGEFPPSSLWRLSYRPEETGSSSPVRSIGSEGRITRAERARRGRRCVYGVVGKTEETGGQRRRGALGGGPSWLEACLLRMHVTPSRGNEGGAKVRSFLS